MILNAIAPFLLSCCSFSFDLGYGVSFWGGFQHSPVDACSAASCSFDVLTGEDECTCFYSAILKIDHFPFLECSESYQLSVWILAHPGVPRIWTTTASDFLGEHFNFFNLNLDSEVVFSGPTLHLISSLKFPPSLAPLLQQGLSILPHTELP